MPDPTPDEEAFERWWAADEGSAAHTYDLLDRKAFARYIWLKARKFGAGPEPIGEEDPKGECPYFDLKVLDQLAIEYWLEQICDRLDALLESQQNRPESERHSQKAGASDPIPAAPRDSTRQNGP